MSSAGFCAIVGRPSSGKSSLLNAMCGHKVAIVSATPQTTRNKVRGIVTREEGQAVFVDTPGFHTSERKLNRYLRELVTGSLEEIDVVLYVADLTRPPGEEEQELAGLLSRLSVPVLIALNKNDLEAAERGAFEELFRRHLPNAPVSVVSAATGAGVEELCRKIVAEMPQGEPMYPEDFYTDQDPEFRVAEIIREHAIEGAREELPHALFVEIADMEVRSTARAAKGNADADTRSTLWIRAFIVVERESQKGIIVGRNGQRIKATRQGAQADIAELFDYRIYLDLRVKVQPKWRRTDDVLSRLVH